MTRYPTQTLPNQGTLENDLQTDGLFGNQGKKMHDRKSKPKDAVKKPLIQVPFSNHVQHYLSLEESKDLDVQKKSEFTCAHIENQLKTMDPITNSFTYFRLSKQKRDMQFESSQNYLKKALNEVLLFVRLWLIVCCRDVRIPLRNFFDPKKITVSELNLLLSKTDTQEQFRTLCSSLPQVTEECLFWISHPIVERSDILPKKVSVHNQPQQCHEQNNSEQKQNQLALYQKITNVSLNTFAQTPNSQKLNISKQSVMNSFLHRFLPTRLDRSLLAANSGYVSTPISSSSQNNSSTNRASGISTPFMGNPQDLVQQHALSFGIKAADICVKCGRKYVIINGMAQFACLNCKLFVPYTDVTHAPAQTSVQIMLNEDQDMMIPKKNATHLNDCIAEIEGSKGHRVPKAVIERTRREVVKNNITDLSKITADWVHARLRDLQLVDHYGKSYAIAALLGGEKPIKFSPHEKATIQNAFSIIQSPFRKQSSGVRKNLLGYAFIVAKLCELYGFQKNHKFRRLQSQHLLGMSDQIWSSICVELGYEYIPSQ